MTQVAAVGNFASNHDGKLDGKRLNYHDTDFRIDRKGNAFFASSKPADAPDSAFGKPQEIVLLTGSHNLQLYWLETGSGRTLANFPLAYIVAEDRWVPVEQTFLVPPGSPTVYGGSDWNVACYNCHVTQGRQRFVSAGKYDSQVSDFGIACEACHSGGREHIEQNRNPLRRFALHWGKSDDKTIANPAKMDGPTASLVCGQCHSVWAFKNQAVELAWTNTGAKFRPGDKELDGRWVIRPDATDHPAERAELLKTDADFMTQRFWGDGMIRVTGRELGATMASPCYKGGKFSCISCHAMHPKQTDAATLAAWSKGQMLTPEMSTSQACIQCHPKFDTPAKLTAHTHHAATSPGSDCYNCHMPHTTYGLLRAIRSHQISNPNVRESTELGRPNACNLCHLDQPLAWTASKLAEWYDQKVPPLTADQQQFSAAVQWLLKGDAEQRLLIAWAMGWAPAQKASGREWFYPYLAFELNDPYAAVRFASWKSLQTLPGFSGYAFDYTVTDDALQKDATVKAYQKWWFEQRDQNRSFPAETMLEPNGMFQQERFDRLLDQRDHRKVYLAE